MSETPLHDVAINVNNGISKYLNFIIFSSIIILLDIHYRVNTFILQTRDKVTSNRYLLNLILKIFNLNYRIGSSIYYE